MRKANGGWLLVLAVILVAGLVLTGCAQNPTETPAPTESAAELPTPTPTPTPTPAVVPDYQTWRVQDIGQQGFAGMQTPCMGGHPVQWDADDYVYVVCDGNTHYSLQHPDYLNGQPFSPCVGYGGMPWNMEEHVLE